MRNISVNEVAILLCTYNGAEYLAEQLDSIEAQSHENWVVYASDDGSNDATLDILHSYQDRWGRDRLIILKGPCQGFARNFMSLVFDSNIKADFYAFSDQDDIWHSDKLERGLGNLSRADLSRPALYCSRTRLVDNKGQSIGYSPLFAKRPSFANALVQSLAGANTMILNDFARRLLALTPRDAHIVSHDWLSYLLVSGAGGTVLYDSEPTLDYRQHGSNLIGANTSLEERWQRVRMLFAGRFSEWNAHNIHALSNAQAQFTQENRGRLQRFESARQAGLLRRLYCLKSANVYRQTLLGNLGLVLAACIGRI